MKTGSEYMKKQYHSGKNTFFVIAMLGILGQIAWGLENGWFNTFAYDVITHETWPIAVMNGASAVTAAVTTFVMGTLSDRKGVRRPFIRYGYLIWGFTTAGFVLSQVFPTVMLRCVMVIVLDCVMTFFGSTAYDACYNAWTTDISDDAGRGKISAVVQLAPLGAQVILAGAGAVIDHFGYNVFFGITGLTVSLCGWIIGGRIQEGETLKPVEAGHTAWQDIVSCFRAETVKAHPLLFLDLLAAGIFLSGFQVVYAYEMIYANQYLGIAKTYASLLSAAGLPLMIIGSILAGKACDSGRGIRALQAGPGIFAAGAFLHAMFKSAAGIMLARALFYGGYMIMNTAVLALFKKYVPADARGRFEGVRMIFTVMCPMIIGPAVGSALIEHFGVSPAVYVMSGIVALCSYSAVYALQRQMRKENPADAGK